MHAKMNKFVGANILKPMVTKNDLKFIKSLKLKKYRTLENKFCVEGRKNIEELLDSSYKVLRILGTEEFRNHLVANDFNVQNFETVKQDLVESLSSFKSNMSGVAVVEKPKPVINHVLNDNELIIALDGVNDPGNLGSIIRSLDWFGFNQLYCSNECAELYNPKTLSATMGSFTRVNVNYIDIEAFLRGQAGVSIYGLTLKGEPIEGKKAQKGIYILGSESHGISKKVLSLLTEEIKISGYGAAESLNVAMTSSILLYHLRTS